MCFTAFSIVSLVTAIVSIQLLRLGLVNRTTDGDTFEKENKVQQLVVDMTAMLINLKAIKTSIKGRLVFF